MRRHFDDELWQRRSEDDWKRMAGMITGRHPGRQSDDARIVAVPQGLTSLDVALANFVYRSAHDQGIGTQVEWP